VQKPYRPRHEWVTFTASVFGASPVRKPVVNVAVQAARRAGKVILSSLNKLDAIRVVDKDRYDFASDVDHRAEAEIIKELRRAFPDHAILAEESGAIGESRYTWVIDPLDGTSNFLRGFPHFSVSIALFEDGIPIHGVVLDPVRDELFTASKGSGAFLNDRRIRIAQRSSLAGALVCTGFPFRQRAKVGPQLHMIKQILEEAEDLRRTGSAALDLCYVAAGRLDAFFEYGLKTWDMGAGVLMVREAGGVCVGFQGDDDFLNHGNLIAANIKLAAKMVGTIKPLSSQKASDPALD